MKTLIIHPQDASTDFLKPIYEGIESKTVLTEGTRKQVMQEIKKHDRIMMMGHGSPSGLFSVGRFGGVFVIDASFVKLLKKKECVFIWCNADKFVELHDLRGLYSGMFVSEVSEASFCGFITDQNTVDESNNLFALWLGEAMKGSLSEAYSSLLPKYKILAEGNKVAAYNQKRLYLK